MADKKTQTDAEKAVKVVQPTYPDFENSWIFEDLDRTWALKPITPKIEC